MGHKVRFSVGALILGLVAAMPAASGTPLDGPDVYAEDFPLDIETPPEPSFDPVPPDAFVEKLVEIGEWIAARTDYPPGIAPPAIVLVPRATLNYVFYSQMVGGYQGQTCINAIYLPHVLMLAEDLKDTDCTDTLVHEMVHHFQFVTGRAFRCTAEAEREAYELQAAWSRETGVGQPPSPLFMRRLTCDNPHDWGLRK